MKTRITELLNIDYPIIQGGLQNVAYPELCAAVSNAGALGAISATIFPKTHDFKEAIKKTKSLTDKPFCVNLSLLPGADVGDSVKEYINICGEEGVKAIETAGIKPDELSPLIRGAGIVHIHKVPTSRHAVSAEKSNVDAVSCVGFECGGHPGQDNIGTMVLARETSIKSTIPVIAGGGIVDGYGVMAALSLGADAALMGTRFLATEEAAISKEHKEWILNATERSTIIIQRSINNQARVANNKAAQKCLEMEARGATLEELLTVIAGSKTKEAYANGDIDAGVFSMGTGCSIINKILPVKDLINEVVADMKKSLERMNTFIN